MRGSILVKYDETPDSRGLSRFDLFVNTIQRDAQFTDVNNYYSTFMFVGDVVRFNLVFTGGQFPNLTIYREDYTTDDEGGDNGIKETLIPFSIVSGTTQLLSVEFTGSTVSDAYNFKYVIDCSSGPTPTFYTWSLGYDASNATDACIDFAISPSTYYTTVPTLQNGIYLYDSNTIFDLSAAGYYSDGTNVWLKSDTTLILTNESPCVIPTPTPTPTVTPTPICNNELTYTNISTSGETTLNYIGPGWYQDYGFFPGWQTGIAPDGNNYGSYASVGFFQRIAKRFVRVGGIPLAFDWQMPFGDSNSNEQDLIDGIIYPGTGLTNTVITVTNVTIC
jgi:hypothetical protein